MRAEALLYQLQVEKVGSNCPVKISFVVTCNKIMCPDFIQMNSSEDSQIELRIYSDNKADIGEYLISVQSIDSLNGLESEPTTLTLSLVDPCLEQIVILEPLPERPVTYSISLEPLKLEITVKKFIPLCPTNFSLQITCNSADCPSFFTVSKTSDEVFMLNVATEDFSTVGLTTVVIMATEEVSGLTSPTLDKFEIQITDPCASQKLSLTGLPTEIGYDLI